MTYNARRTVAGLAGLLLLTGVAACGGTSTTANASVPGVTTGEIVLGTHQPLTGPAAPGYSKISAATKAYFDYVNANGGVYGRKIVYKIIDDGYDPARTQQVVRQLVLQDKVFAILNGLGTPTHTGVLDFLKTNRVPDLFVASGSLSWNQPRKYPDTFGFQPDYTIEGKVLGNYIKQNFAGQKVCVFGQHDDFGADGLKGVQAVLGPGGVAHTETYDVTNTNVAPQVGALKAAGCQVTVAFTVPGFTALTLGTAAQIGFRTRWAVSNVGSDYATLAGFLKNATPLLLEGMISDGYLPAPTDTGNPWISLFQRLNSQYNGGAAFDGNVEYGFAVGYLTVQALKAAGKNLTREGLLKAVAANGFSDGPGLAPLRFSPTDHSGYGGVQIATVHNGAVSLSGPLYTTDDGDGPIQQGPVLAATPPANGIPG